MTRFASKIVSDKKISPTKTECNLVAISFKNVSFTYDSDEDNVVLALSNISFDIHEGEFVTLCGGNGSGKSTLSKLTNGLLLPDSGSVEIFGIKTTPDEGDKKNKRIYDIRSTVGLIFQNPDNQMVASIIEDDIAFGPENLGVPRDEIEQRITWALKTVGMEKYRTHTPTKLSGGQKQRIAIAGVLSMEPEILIFDEATSMLDPKGRGEVMSVAKKLNAQGITVINITHNMDEVVMGDRVLALNDGQLVFDGTPKELFKDVEILKRAKLDLPPVAKFRNMLIERGIKVSEDILQSNELVEEIWQLLK